MTINLKRLKYLNFDGYLKVYSDYEKNEDKIIPELVEGNNYKASDILSEQHFTKPPARYTEGETN